MIHTQRRQCFQSFSINRRRFSWSRSENVDTVRDEEDEVDEESIGWTFDFEVAEETIGAEATEWVQEPRKMGGWTE